MYYPSLLLLQLRALQEIEHACIAAEAEQRRLPAPAPPAHAFVVALGRNDSLVSIVTTVVGVSIALAIVGFFLDNRGSSRYEIPIESAE